MLRMSNTFNTSLKLERSTSDRNLNSSKRAKRRLSANKFNKRRKTNACINCGEVVHLFNDCPKPKPRLLERVVDIADSTTRSTISELPSVIDESCVTNLNTDYANDFVKHQLNNALDNIREHDVNPPVGCVFDHSLTTSIDTTLSPSLGDVGEKILYSGKSVESRVKRVVKRKLVSRSKRPSTDGWRLRDKEFNNSTILTNLQWRDVATLSV